MKHSYFSEEEVISALGGLQNKYIQKRKTIYYNVPVKLDQQ